MLNGSNSEAIKMRQQMNGGSRRTVGGGAGDGTTRSMAIAGSLAVLGWITLPAAAQTAQ